MSSRPTAVESIRAAVGAVIERFQVGDELENFSLAIPDAQTTTVDSVQGWDARPPVIVICPGCDSQIPQRRSDAELDCPGCHRSYSARQIGELELEMMVCPRCGEQMDHGVRHPMLFDVPEWATCPSCQYHWDLDHWFPRSNHWW